MTRRCNIPDMAPEYVRDLVGAPAEEVVAATNKELKGYNEELYALGLGGTADFINSEIGSAQNEGVAGEGGGLFLSGKTAKKRAKQ